MRKIACFLFIACAVPVRCQTLPQGVTQQDGILILEDDGLLLFRDIPLTLKSPASIRFTPNSQNSLDARQAAFSYEPTVGRLIVDQFSYDDWQLVQLPFSYTFGGVSYQSVRVSRFGGIRLGDSPGPALKRSDGSFYPERPYDLVSVASDRAPRIFPLYIGPIHSRPRSGSGETGVWAATDSSKAVFTWRGTGFDATAFAPVDFQLVLLPSGEFQVNYRKLDGAQYGAFVATTGKESWWDSLHSLASVGAQDGLSSKLVKSISISQMGNSDILTLSVALNAAPGEIVDPAFQVGVKFSTASGSNLGRMYLSVSTGTLDSVNTGNLQGTVEPATLDSYGLSYPPAINGNTVIFYVPASFFGISGGTYQASFFETASDATFSATAPLAVQIEQNLSSDITKLPYAGSVLPVVQVWTPPAISQYAVARRLANLGVDGLLVYTAGFDQYTGGNTNGGNPGADGIGPRNSLAAPIAPSVVFDLAVPFVSDASLQNILHGFGHRWLYYISILENGVPSHSINPDLIHPSWYAQHCAAFPLSGPGEVSAMAGDCFQDAGSGTYSRVNGNARHLGYSWQELYLMGLACPTEVPDWFYLKNPVDAGGIVTGTRVPVSIKDVAAANGSRNPDCTHAQRSFRVPMVLLKRAAQQLPPELLTRAQILRANWKQVFEKSVGNRAAVDTSLPGSGGSTASPASITLYSGNRQYGRSGDQFPEALAVTVRDKDALPVKSVAVAFSVVSGTGQVQLFQAMTDVFGHAFAFFTAGTSPATTIRASVDTTNLSVDFQEFVSSPFTSDPSYIMSTVAGTGEAGFSGDGGPAASARLNGPKSILIDSSNNLYFSDTANRRVRRIAVNSGTIDTFAGTGVAGSGGDGGPAKSASFNGLAGLAFDSTGGLLVSDYLASRIRRIDPITNFVTPFAGTGFTGLNGDNIPASSANIWGAAGVAREVAGSILVAAGAGALVRRVNTNGNIVTVAGTGTAGGKGDGGPALSAQIDNPTGLVAGSDGSFWISEPYAGRVRRVDKNGTITTALGAIDFPTSLALDGSGNLLITRYGSITRLHADGTADTIAGSTASTGFGGDGGPAQNALLSIPWGIATDTVGNIIFADSGNNRIRKLAINGFGIPATVSIIQGNSLNGLSGSAMPVTVEVRDGTGSLVQNALVSFAAQNGTVNPSTAVTGPDGRASMQLTPGLGQFALKVTLPEYPGGLAANASGTGTKPVPLISAVQDAASARMTVVPGSWAAIYGSNFSNTTRTWLAADFINGAALPTTLDGVSVAFDGRSAAVFYVSPGQLDVQVPSGINITSTVTVTRNGTASPAFTATTVPNAPSIFAYSAAGKLFAAATHADGSLVGDPSIVSGSKAIPGESIVIYANGVTASPSGSIVATPIPYSGAVIVTIGSVAARVDYAGLVAAGEFQLNVRIPAGLPDGNYEVVIQAEGQVSPPSVLLPIGS